VQLRKYEDDITNRLRQRSLMAYRTREGKTLHMRDLQAK